MGELIDFAVEGLSFVLAIANVAHVDEHNIVSLLEFSDVRSLLQHFVSDAYGGDDSRPAEQNRVWRRRTATWTALSAWCSVHCLQWPGAGR